jgi:hypothetical protein
MGYRLFLGGYTAERLDRETVAVRHPDGTRYRVNTLFQTCACQEAAEHRHCEHLLGYAALLCEQEAYEEAQVAALEEQNNEWGLTLENDRTERILREMGVCEL